MSSESTEESDYDLTSTTQESILTGTPEITTEGILIATPVITTEDILTGTPFVPTDLTTPTIPTTYAPVRPVRFLSGEHSAKQHTY